jgi:hypothetical protein
MRVISRLTLVNLISLPRKPTGGIFSISITRLNLAICENSRGTFIQPSEAVNWAKKEYHLYHQAISDTE